MHEELIKLNNRFDDWNKTKREFSHLVSVFSEVNPLVLGIGVPTRSLSYILGRKPTKVEENKLRDAHSASGSIGANAGNSYAENS